MKEREKKQVLLWISQGKIQRAIDFLLNLPWPPEDRQEVITIAAQFQSLERNTRMGTLTDSIKNTQENKIIAALIGLVNQVGTDYSNPFASSDLSTKPRYQSKVNSDTDQSLNGETKAIKYISLLGSLASIIALLLYLWTPDTPAVGSLPLTILVEDNCGQAILANKGELSISFGDYHRTAAIGEGGRTSFGEISSRFIDSLFTVDFEMDGYELVNGKNKFVFRGKTIALAVKRDHSLGILKGVVTDLSGQYFIADVAIQINKKFTIKTDAKGRFKVLLPETMRVKDSFSTYQVLASKKGYKPQVKTYYPRSEGLEFRLKKEPKTPDHRAASFAQ